MPFFTQKQNLTETIKSLFLVFHRPWIQDLPRKGKEKVMLAESGFDPPTCELWARHASPAPLRFSSHKRHPSRSLCSKTIFDGEEGYSFSSTSQNTSEPELLNLFKVNRGSKFHYHCHVSSFLTSHRVTQSFAQNHFRYVSLPHNIRNICYNVSFKHKALFCRMKQGKQKHGTEEREMKWGERICCFCEKEKREKYMGLLGLEPRTYRSSV